MYFRGNSSLGLFLSEKAGLVSLFLVLVLVVWFLCQTGKDGDGRGARGTTIDVIDIGGPCYCIRCSLRILTVEQKKLHWTRELMNSFADQ